MATLSLLWPFPIIHCLSHGCCHTSGNSASTSIIIVRAKVIERSILIPVTGNKRLYYWFSRLQILHVTAGFPTLHSVNVVRIISKIISQTDRHLFLREMSFVGISYNLSQLIISTDYHETLIISSVENIVRSQFSVTGNSRRSQLRSVTDTKML